MSPHLCGYKCSMMWRLSTDSSLSVSVSMFHRDLLKKEKDFRGWETRIRWWKGATSAFASSSILYMVFLSTLPLRMSFFSWRNAVRICVTLTLFTLFTHAPKRRNTQSHPCASSCFWAINGYHECYLGQLYSHRPWEAWLEVQTWFNLSKVQLAGIAASLSNLQHSWVTPEWE